MNFGCMEPIPGNFGPISEWVEVDRTRPRNSAVKTTVFDTFQELLWVGYNDVFNLIIIFILLFFIILFYFFLRGEYLLFMLVIISGLIDSNCIALLK